MNARNAGMLKPRQQPAFVTREIVRGFCARLLGNTAQL